MPAGSGHYGPYGETFEECVNRTRGWSDNPEGFCNWIHQQFTGGPPGAEDQADQQHAATPGGVRHLSRCDGCDQLVPIVDRDGKPVFAPHAGADHATDCARAGATWGALEVQRWDVGELDPPRLLENGWLRGDGVLTRTGIFRYKMPDGSVLRELRLPGEVFAPDALASFAMVPVTLGHPPERLTAINTAQYSVGSVGDNVHRRGDQVRASLLLTDGRAIAAAHGGTNQLSCGYRATLDFTSGKWKGEEYDVVQRRIRGNHIALVDVARAGPEARLRMDAHDGVMVQTAAELTRQPTEERTVPDPQTKFRIDGVDYDLTHQVAQAVDKERHDAAGKVATLEKERDGLKRERDAAAAERDQAKADQAKEKKRADEAEKPERIQKLVADRVVLEVEARRHLTADVKLDGLTDRQVREQVIKKLSPEAKLDGVSDDYIRARFDAAVEAARTQNPALDEARRAAVGDAGNGQGAAGTGNGAAGSTGQQHQDGDEKAARKRMLAENQKMATGPIPGAAKA